MSERETKRHVLELLRGWFPLTSTGFIILLAGSFFSWRSYSVNSDLVLWTAGSSAILLVLLSVLSVFAAAMLLVRGTSKGQTSLKKSYHCGEVTKTGFSLGAIRFIPFIKVAERWIDERGNEVLKGVDVQGGEEILEPTRRTLITNFRREFTARHVFGLSEISFSRKYSLQTPLIIVPANSKPASRDALSRPKELGGGEKASSEGQPEGDRMEIRKYQPGDSVRFLHWKIMARTGGQKKYIRDPELVVDQRVALYFIAGEGDEPSAELAKYVLDKKPFGGDWIFGVSTNGSDTASTQKAEEADRLLAESGNYEEVNPASASNNFKKFQEASRRAQAACCIIFCPHVEPGDGQPDWIEILKVEGFRHRYVYAGFHDQENVKIDEIKERVAKIDPKIVPIEMIKDSEG